MTSLSNLPPPPLLPHEEEEELRRLGRGDRRRLHNNHGSHNQTDDGGHHTDEETLSSSSKEPLPDSDCESDLPIQQTDERRETQAVSSAGINPTDDQEAAAALLLYCHNSMQHQTQAAQTPTKSPSEAASSTPSTGLSGLALLAGAANQPMNRRNQIDATSFYSPYSVSSSASHHPTSNNVNPPPRKAHVGLPYQDHNYGAPPPPTPPASPPPFSLYEEERVSSHQLSHVNHGNHAHGHPSGSNIHSSSLNRSGRSSTSVPTSHFSSNSALNHHTKNNNFQGLISLGSHGFERTERGSISSGALGLTKEEKGLLRQQKKRRRKELELAVQEAQGKNRGFEDAFAKLNEPSLDWEEGEASITRCICGFNHDDEYMICCDGCGVWQHVECMGLDKNQIPETYFCEKCMPRKLDRTRAKALQMRKKDKLSPLRYSAAAAALDPSSLSFGRQQDDHGLNKFLDVGMAEMGLANGLTKKHFNRRFLKAKQKQILKGLRGRVTLKGKMKENKGQRGLKSSLTSQNSPGTTSATSGRKTTLKNGKLSVQRKLLAQDALSKLRSSKLHHHRPPAATLNRQGLHQGTANNLPVEDDVDDIDGHAEGDLVDEEFYEESLINQYTPEVQILTLRGNSAAQETLLKRIMNMHSTKSYRLCRIDDVKRLVASTNFEPGFPIAEIRGRFMIMDQFAGNRKTSQQHVLFYSPTGRPLNNRVMKNNRDSSDEEGEDDDFEETLCVDSRRCGNEARSVRRSCHPNSELRHVVQNGLLQLWIVAGSRGVRQDEEITIEFELPPAAGLECACDKASCSFRTRGKPQQQHQNMHHGQQHSAQASRPKKLSLYDRKASVNLRSSSPTSKPVVSSPITPITHKGLSSPSSLSPAKESKEHLHFPKQISPITPPKNLCSPTVIKREKEESEDVIEVDEAVNSPPPAISIANSSSPTKAAGVRKRRTSSLAAEVAIKQEAADELDIKTERAESQDGVHTTTVHHGESANAPTSTEKCAPRGAEEKGSASERKMTREERKLDAIMRAFEKMEQKQKRKQMAAEHKLTPAKDSDKRRSSVANNDCLADERHVSNSGSSAKKGRRKSGCTPMKRGRARTISGCSEVNNSGKDSSNDCFAQPAKSKRLLMQGWLQEKHNGASDLFGGDSPSQGTHGHEKEEESVCFVRESHSVGNPMAHLKRSNSLTTAMNAQGVNTNSATGAGSAKKRWLRQAMFDDGDSTPEAHSPNTSAVHSLISSEPSNHIDDDNNHGDYVTPLKKRRLMRESMDSSSPLIDSPHRSPTDGERSYYHHEDEDQKDTLVDVVDVLDKEENQPEDKQTSNEIANDSESSNNHPISENDTDTTSKLDDIEGISKLSPMDSSVQNESSKPTATIEEENETEDENKHSGTKSEPDSLNEDHSTDVQSPKTACEDSDEHLTDTQSPSEKNDIDSTKHKEKPNLKSEKDFKLSEDGEHHLNKDHKGKDKERKTAKLSSGSKESSGKIDKDFRSARHGKESVKSCKDTKVHSKYTINKDSKSSKDLPTISSASTNKIKKDKTSDESPVTESDPFARALVIKNDRKQKDKDKSGKDKTKDNRHRRDRRDRLRESRERSSVDEPVEELHHRQNFTSGDNSSNESKASETEEERQLQDDTQVTSEPAIETNTHEKQALKEDSQEDGSKHESSNSQSTPDVFEMSGSKNDSVANDTEELIVGDGSTTPTMDEVDEGSPIMKTPTHDDAPVRLPPAETLKAPKQNSDLLRDRKKKVSLSEYLKRQRSEPAPSNNRSSASIHSNNNNNNNTILRSPLKSGLKLAPISNEVLGNFAKITGPSKASPAPVSSLGRSKSISDPTSTLSHLPSSIKSSLPAAVTAPPMQLLTPPVPGTGTSSLHKAALFPDIPERRGEQGSSSLDSPQIRREPLSQRLRREFGLCSEEGADVPLVPPSVPNVFPAAGSFPTATVQTPNGPQQVFYVPQASSSLTSIAQRGQKSPLSSSTIPSAGPRNYIAGSVTARPRANAGNSAGAGYKPGFY